MIIRLTESQLHRLIENAPNFDGGDIKEYGGFEINPTKIITKQDGDKTYGKPKTTDKVQDDLATQNYYGLNVRVSNNRLP